MHRPAAVAVTMATLLLAASSAAHPVLDLIAADRDAGLLTEVEAALHRLRWVTGSADLPERYDVDDAPPVFCATPIFVEIEGLRPRMDAAQRAVADALLRPRAVDKTYDQYISPSGRFRMIYTLDGDAAVSAIDRDPANGWPDYIEQCAAYMDSSYASLVTRHGFGDPPLQDGFYDVTFVDTDEFLGATYSIEGSHTATRIELLNTYDGLSWSIMYPDVTADDIAKMVCTHELKHATQRAQSSWSEGPWVELDATWSQDIVYDEENDYRRYLSGEAVGVCALSHPHVSLHYLDPDVPGLYEEMLWQIWMSEHWGVGFVTDIWERRERHTSEPMLDTYDVILQEYGSSLEEGFPLFAGWNFLCGETRSVTDAGYGDAYDYPSVDLSGTFATYPRTREGSVDSLASRHYFVTGLPESGYLHLEFDGQDDRTLAVAVAVKRDDGTGEVLTFATDAANDIDEVVPVSLDDVLLMGLVVANPTRDEGGSAYAATLSIVEPPALALDASDLSLEGVSGAGGVPVDLVLEVPAGGANLGWSTAADYADGAATGWLTASPNTGGVAPGGDAVIEVGVDATSLPAGVHEAELVLSFWTEPPLPGSEARDQGLVFRRRVPVTVTVTAGGGLAFDRLGPNPTRDATTLHWGGTKRGEIVDIAVHDLRGRVVRRERVDVLSGDESSWTWDGLDDDGRRVPSGRYLIRLAAGGAAATTSVVMLR